MSVSKHNKVGAANSRRAGQLDRRGSSFTTTAFRGQSPAAVADLYRCTDPSISVETWSLC